MQDSHRRGGQDLQGIDAEMDGCGDVVGLGEESRDAQQVAGLDSVSNACAMRGSLVAQAQTTSSAALSVGETVSWNGAVPELSPGVGTVSR
ncbi:hypothetical protein [Streptomyces sp. NEAU-YJ-81]|uniref:hypothetical protein n=1 Tax=Streptomyces sp. NEAU-YJ-81 TaxID=2820288 RepID=UPI001ABCEBA5|nr:hypothetical protein [Streptomyces sp. NEAU-YJ-81]MBO3675706.1 hypothetical protein [Streptomyces sp. NEAU-YJ-81]